MTDPVCERTRSSLSAVADGEPAVVDDEHVASCASCASFQAGVRGLRSRLRFEVLDGAPDVAPRVLDVVSSSPTIHRWLPSAAALVAGVVLGAAFVWPSDGGDVAVASLPARVVAAQHDVASVSAQLTVTDPTETRTGTLRYRAPETLELRIGKHVMTVGDDGEPFVGDAPVALDLVLPVAGFTGAAGPASLGSQTLDGRRAIGVRVTAAQVDGLLTGLQVGAESEVHPTDPVDVWLDRDHLVPLAVLVRAAAGPDRARWAAARDGATAGDVVLEARLSQVIVNDARSVDGLEAPPAANASRYRDGSPTGPTPSWLPAGMAPWRAGSAGEVSIATWTDGRAWIKVRSTTTWDGTHLFGDVGRAVRPIRLGEGIAYAAEGGNAVAVHGVDVDAVVTGSVGPAALRRVAASLGMTGLRVPAEWDEAATATIDEVTEHLDVLVLPDDSGFSPPATRLDGVTATLVFAGPGERLLTLVTRPGSVLTPPLDPDAVGVVVRGRDARWSPSRGDLEWVEGEQVWSLRTRTIGLGELVGLADSLAAS